MTEHELRAKVEYAFANEFNHTLHAYIDIAGDLIAGTLLGQVLFWFTPAKDGRKKTRILKEGYYWIAKRREDWETEIRISAKQFDRAIKILEGQNLVETKKFKFNGSPTTHIRPLYRNINSALAEWKNRRARQISESEQRGVVQQENFNESGSWNSPFGEVPNIPMGENELDELGNSITEHTTKQTTEPFIKKERKRNGYDEILSQIEDDSLRELYLDYIKMRKMIKAPMTDRALTILINKVEKLEPTSIARQKRLLETAIVNSWKSVYPLKDTDERNNADGRNARNNGEDSSKARIGHYL